MAISDLIFYNITPDTFLVFFNLSLTCLMINTTCDPIIYAFRIAEIREGFRKRICCCRNDVVSQILGSRVSNSCDTQI